MDQKSDTQQNSRNRNARMAIGTGTGVSLGMAFSGRERESSRPLTIAGVALLLVGIIVLGLVMSLVLPHWWCDYPILNLFPGC
jgi:hypothetical protein